MQNTTSPISIWKKIDGSLQQFGCSDNPKSPKLFFAPPSVGLNTKRCNNKKMQLPRFSFSSQLESILCDANPVNYEGFRYHVDSIDQPQIKSIGEFTLIFDTQKCLRAVIQAARIDTSNQCQPIRYFIIARSNQTQLAGQKYNARMIATLALEKCLAESQQSLAKLTQRLKRSKSTPILPRETKIVWTTLRLSR